MNLLIAESPLMVLPTLAERIGLEESIFIQQIHYLTMHSRNVKDGKRWVYNTYADWLKIFPFLQNVDKVKRIVLKLEKLGVLITQKDPTPMNRRKWYRVNYASEVLNIEQADLPDEQADLPDEQADLPDEQADLPPAINKEFQQRISAKNKYPLTPAAADDNAAASLCAADAPLVAADAPTTVNRFADNFAEENHIAEDQADQSGQPSFADQSSVGDKTNADDNGNADNQALQTKPKRKTRAANVPCAELLEAYNEILGEVLPKAQLLTDTRKRRFTARWLEIVGTAAPNGKIRYTGLDDGLVWWRSFFAKVKRNSFWLGDNTSAWRADLDWILKPTNFVKILEWKPVKG